jgi:hypothetical protein
MMAGVDDAPLSEEQIKQLRLNLSRLSESGVEDAYKEAYRQCELKSDRLPTPVAIQQLVQAWRQMWMWRRKR